MAIYHVVSEWDNVIIPASAAKYDDILESNIYYYGGLYSHAGIVHDEDVAQSIVQWLSR